jgi:hypothetical protein
MKRKIHEVPFKGRHCSCDFWVLFAAVSKVTILGPSVSSVGRAYIIHRLTKNRGRARRTSVSLMARRSKHGRAKGE